MCSKLDQERIKGPLSPLRWSHSLKQPSLADASVAGHVAMQFVIAPSNKIRILECGKLLLMESRIQKKFAAGIQNPGLWIPEYSSRNPEFDK